MSHWFSPVVGVLLFVSPVAPSDGRPQGVPPSFGSQVSLVSLPVFVVNSKGEAWAGLEKEDFQLWDDGKAVPVVAFQYIDTTSAEAQEAVRDLPAARRHFLFLFDLSFTSTAGLKRAKDAAEDFVRTGLGDSDLAAVATFDVSRGTRLIANFSDDRFLLLHAIETLGVPFLTRIHDPLNLAASLDRPDVPLRVSTGSTGDSATQSFLRTLAAAMRATDDRVYREHVLGFTRGLEGLGHSLAAVEGRKQILLFSAGFDPQTLVGTVSSSTARTDSEAVTGGRLWEVSEERFGDIAVRGVLSTLVRTLSSSDCVLHTLDVTGLGGARDVQEKAAAQSLERQDNGRESLSYLAAETGGRFFSNTNDLRAPLREVDAMTNRYYILGYQPDDL
ncbi:MAG TPA: VWA domain-containing protein, partial [Vicinamibacteria bacterium]|nr:VWA domain-containing protein [Vicinamibacteria bacterium]